MASPQKENGYTAIANELIEHICKCPFNGTQYAIILFIMRQTYGFSRKSHDISLSVLCTALAVEKKNKRNIQRELQNLIDANVIHVLAEATFSRSREIAINKDYETWDVVFRQQTAKTSGDGENATTTGGEIVTTTGGENTAQRNKDKTNIKQSLSSEQSPDGERVADANKKPKSGGRKKMIYSHDGPYYKSAAWLAKKIESNFPEYKKHEEKDIQTWADSARLMFEKDGRNRETANILLRFSQNDDFWKKNIRSMPTFREQYDQLLAKCPEAQKNKASPDPWASNST